MKYALLTPWKIAPSSQLSSFVQEFLERTQKHTPVQWITPASTLASEDKIEQFLTKEARKLKQNGFALYFLDERGKQLRSDEFAALLEKAEISAVPGIAFCFGGAYGLPAGLRDLKPFELLSLTNLTLQHELAFAVFVEQLYRARCILSAHPYHHGEKSPLMKALGR